MFSPENGIVKFEECKHFTDKHLCFALRSHEEVTVFETILKKVVLSLFLRNRAIKCEPVNHVFNFHEYQQSVCCIVCKVIYMLSQNFSDSSACRLRSPAHKHEKANDFFIKLETNGQVHLFWKELTCPND